ncbi:hypothetical protein GCM10007927_03370 [Sulfitobacter pacificus]|uniref:Uncharacterized protein n=1 Tax=Sulfitobacter pacificus TaxID=1499314 RepID=A0ABQ5VDE9_9RHOB|nr:hypothetical protein GCM10007927_03370 [Sulfitobacter pacificus]
MLHIGVLFLALRERDSGAVRDGRYPGQGIRLPAMTGEKYKYPPK